MRIASPHLSRALSFFTSQNTGAGTNTAHLSDGGRCPVIEIFIETKGMMVVNVLTAASQSIGDVKPPKGIKRSKV